MSFSEPGIKLNPDFKFAPVQLTAGKLYRVRYEITSGGPITLHGTLYTLETSWDDALPLSVDQYDGLGGIYAPLNLELYEPDTPEKRDAMIQVLDQSDYIVISSNRAYDAMPRLPLRYPLTLKYYQALFDCNCNGDAMEKRAYGLEPPFKSPLGFDLVATFESPPSLGPLSVSDQSADESFTVYEHPKVFIFKKSNDFSIEAVKTLLNSVDLDQIVFQSPMGYTQAPSAMQLPADRLAAQLKGGTWAEMFNRAALLNVNELLAGITWYLLLLLLGWMVFPVVYTVLPGLPDRGYPLVRTAGLIIVGWLAWFLGSFKLLPFTRLTIVLCTGLALVISAVFAFRRRQELAEYIRSNWKYILGIELMFLVLFLFSLYVRLGNPDLWHPWHGGEKPMDFAFFNAVLKAVYFPPENPWFSGHYINYYYYGYVLASILTKLLGILPSIAYNLILPSWFAMIGSGVFCVAFNLVAGFRRKSLESKFGPANEELINPTDPAVTSRLGKWLPYLAGVISIIAVLILGNLYMVREFWIYLPELTSSGGQVNGPIERAGAVIGGAVQVLSGSTDLPGENSRWYFDASRPILHDGPDTPIAEFPYFTFLYGDPHAHLLTMPTYALALGWMLSLLLYPFARMKWPERIVSLIFAGLVFGSFLPSHTWDFPTFIGLGALVILWNVWQSRSGSIQHTIQVIIGYELAFLGSAVVLYWPFRTWFHTEYASLELWTGARTPLVDYLFVFGLPLFVIISLLIRDLSSDLKALYTRWVASPRPRKFNWRRIEPYIIFLIGAGILSALWIYNYHVVAFGLPLLAGMAYLVFFKRGLSFLQRIIWIMFAVGLSLTMLVEVVVLKGDVGRSNMVFRFYDQAWFLFGLAIGIALFDLISGMSRWPGWLRFTWSCMLGLLVLSAASYPLIATGKRMSDRWPDILNPPHSLDGAKFMLGEADDPSGQNPAIYNDENRKINLALDYAGIQFMQDHISGSPVIVEGHTEEYRWGSRYAIYTGLPSVIGWSWHTRQQNTLLDGSIIDNRINELNDFYNTTDIEAARKFLNRYKVQYIIVSDLERDYYSAEGIAKFQEMVNQGLLQVVFGDNTPNTATIYHVTEAN
jgi:YYY domain-containing protein